MFGQKIIHTQSCSQGNKFFVYVWGRIVEDNLCGQYFLSSRLSGRVYLDFLQNFIQELLYNMSLGIKQNL